MSNIRKCSSFDNSITIGMEGYVQSLKFDYFTNTSVIYSHDFSSEDIELLI